MNSSVVSSELYRTYLKELDNIREEEEKGIYFEKIKSGAPSDATWGTEMIYDQRVYNKISGTFGPWGNIPENVVEQLRFKMRIKFLVSIRDLTS